MIRWRMLRKALTHRAMIPVILCLQVVPLLVFPRSSYTLKSQEWWLPVLLTCFVVIGLVQLLARRSLTAWTTQLGCSCQKNEEPNPPPTTPMRILRVDSAA